MLILGHDIIPSEKIETISFVEQIQKTPPNSTVFFQYNIDLMKYCFDNNLPYGVYVNSIKQAIFANSLGAKYIIVMSSHAKEIQDIANEYMFDSKILQVIYHESHIEDVAKHGVDGVVFENILRGML